MLRVICDVVVMDPYILVYALVNGLGELCVDIDIKVGLLYGCVDIWLDLVHKLWVMSEVVLGWHWFPDIEFYPKTGQKSGEILRDEIASGRGVHRK